MEQSNSFSENTPRPEDLQAALELINEHPELKRNAAVMQMVKNDFKAPGGQRDPGEYLAAMIAFLDSKNGEVVTDEDITAAAERAIQTMIVHSDTWQNEHRPN